MTNETTALVRQMRDALEAMASDMTVGQRYTNAGQETLDALAAANEWLAQPSANQCGETCERTKLCAVCACGLEDPPLA